MAEVKELEEAKKANAQRLPHNRVKPELAPLACFYLDQLVLYLHKAYAQQPTNESSINSTNEEKIKEMWGKLLYSVCRCPTPQLVKLVNYLFSVLTAFQYLSKNFYEHLILKKLEFEPLFSELAERFRHLYNGVVLDHLKQSSP